MFFVPSAYPGSPEGTTGTSSLGEFWRQEFGKCRGRETDEATDPSLNHPLTMIYMGAGSGGEKGRQG